MFYRADWWTGLLLGLIGLAMIGLTFTFPVVADSPGPTFFPRITGALLLALGVRIAWRGRLAAGQPEALSPAFIFRATAFVTLTAAYLGGLAGLPALGFPFLTPPYVFAVALIFGGRVNFALVAASVVIPELVYLFFRNGLDLALPASAWF